MLNIQAYSNPANFKCKWCAPDISDTQWQEWCYVFPQEVSEEPTLLALNATY